MDEKEKKQVEKPEQEAVGGAGASEGEAVAGEEEATGFGGASSVILQVEPETKVETTEARGRKNGQEEDGAMGFWGQLWAVLQ
eukprot:115526-Rhodomonas_salina.1